MLSLSHFGGDKVCRNLLAFGGDKVCHLVVATKFVAFWWRQSLSHFGGENFGRDMCCCHGPRPRNHVLLSRITTMKTCVADSNNFFRGRPS